MQVDPPFEDFSGIYEKGQAQVVSTSLVADLETPVSAMLKLASGKPNSFLLESVEGGAVRGRYSIIGLRPDLIWQCHGNQAEINRDADSDGGTFEPCTGDALDSLRMIVEESRIDLPEALPPMAAGLVGYLGYDTVALMERVPSTRPDPLKTPDGLFVRPTIMAIFDLVKDTVTIVTPVRPDPKTSTVDAYEAAIDRLVSAVTDFERGMPEERVAGAEPGPVPTPVSNTDPDTYMDMVRKAKDYIIAGDVFQVVLSQRFSIPFTLPPFSLYRALRRTNPSPFLFFLNFGDFSVVGSSPEILVRLRDGKVTLRPLAGTRPRGETSTQDAALAEELLADEKELAEHLMLLDLGRNDVGRVAKIGTVEVTEKMVIERYSHVMHIVSNVEAEIDDKHDAMDALIGGFPAGTVSGAPKIRAMEIIDELEKEKRGIYAGTVGYFSANGSMDTCIVLRTALVKDGTMYVQSGAGIVTDSDPESEHRECQNKALALIRAAEEAVRYAGDRSGNQPR
ncbi:MAG: anthranilate synthase component I [Rhodospirillaceae bacterium]|jgi:anthranilate synthase component 1|nr:anthranilate synthase component I [Rhodospirillaceae bacterium]MBT5456777.1 anthranilate synthase component I [Rhodospirillaceae bacterium]